MGQNSPKALLSGPIARGSVVSMAVRLAGLALVTLQAILTARLLGPEGYGIVAYVISLSSIFAFVALFGTQPLAVREVARHHSGGNGDALSGFLRAIRRMLLFLILVTAALWIVGTFSFVENPMPILMVALLFPIFAVTLQSQGILRGFGIVALSQVPYMVLRPFVMVCALGVAALGSISVAPIGYLAAATIAAALAALLAWGSVRPLTKDLPIAAPLAIAPLARDATPFFIVSLVTLVMGEINTLMLAWWAGPEETGLFQPIARITPVLMLGMQSVAVRYGPRVSEFWSAGETERLQAITHKTTLATTGFTLLASVALVVLGKPILGLFGPAFTENSAALIWIAAAQVFNAACGPVGLLLTMSDKASAAVWPRLVALIINIGLGALLIPGLGAMGAAMAMAAGIVVWNLAMLLAVKRRMGFDPSLVGALRSLR